MSVRRNWLQHEINERTLLSWRDVNACLQSCQELDLLVHITVIEGGVPNYYLASVSEFKQNTWILGYDQGSGPEILEIDSNTAVTQLIQGEKKPNLRQRVKDIIIIE